MRSGAKPASGRAVAIARSFEMRTCDCWQLCAATIVTANSATNAITPRLVSRAGRFGGSSGGGSMRTRIGRSSTASDGTGCMAQAV